MMFAILLNGLLNSSNLHCKKFIGNFSKYIQTAPCVPYIIGSQYGGYESNSIRKFFRKKGNTSEYWRTEIHRIEIQLYTERSVQSGYIWKNFRYFFTVQSGNNRRKILFNFYSVVCVGWVGWVVSDLNLN